MKTFILGMFCGLFLTLFPHELSHWLLCHPTSAIFFLFPVGMVGEMSGETADIFLDIFMTISNFY